MTAYTAYRTNLSKIRSVLRHEKVIELKPSMPAIEEILRQEKRKRVTFFYGTGSEGENPFKCGFVKSESGWQEVNLGKETAFSRILDFLMSAPFRLYEAMGGGRYDSGIYYE